MTYEQEWAQYQELLKNVQRVNNELLVAENARNADQLSLQQGGKQTDTRHLDPNIESLRAEKIAAETKVSLFVHQLAESNLQHSQWLSEQLPPAQNERLPRAQDEQISPAQEKKIEVGYALDAPYIAAQAGAKLMDIDTSAINDVPIGNSAKELTAYVIENTENMYNNMSDAARQFVQNGYNPDPANEKLQYEQEWRHYQELLKDVQRVNDELLVAENTRNADQLSLQQDGKQTDTQHLDANIENLREEKIAAETKASLFVHQLAESNLQHSQWLSEQLPPAQEKKIDVGYVLDAANIVAQGAAQGLGIDTSAIDDVPMGNSAKELTAYVIENTKNMYNYTAGAVREFVQNRGDNPDPAKEWEKDIDKGEQVVNEKLENKNIIINIVDSKRQEMYERQEKQFSKLSLDQNAQIKSNKEQTPEMEAKFDEQQKALKEIHNKEIKAFDDWQKKIDGWQNDIDKKKIDLKATHERQNIQLENIRIVQIDRLNETKKDGYEQKLEEIKKNREAHKIDSPKELQAKIEKIDKEKEALQKAVETTKDLVPEKRAEGIEDQKKEFERQRELERQRQLEEQNKSLGSRFFP